MIRCLIGIWRVISSLLFRYEVESPRARDSETGQSSDQKPASSSSSSFPMLNDHIYELFKPVGEPALEILFFHGLQLENSIDPAYLSTWRAGDGSQQVWPATWLAEVFPDAHIFSISYDSSMRMTAEHGRSDLFIVAENIRHALCSANIGQGFRRPLILVGHSFGGLVMKELCVDAHRAHKENTNPDSKDNQKIGKFLSNVRGLFFYGTPHRGIPGLPKIAGRSLDGLLLGNVEVLSTEAARLESSFGIFCSNFKIRCIAGVGELHETSWGALKGLVVPEASARYGDFSTVGADHFSLCKPSKKTSNSFQRLINFIRQVHIDAPFGDVQRLPEVAVCLDFRVEAIRNMLQEKPRVGIFGMGGVGKTTVARAVFNRLGPTFEYSCFCPDVKLIEAHSVNDLKKRVWEHMHCDGKKIVGEQQTWSNLRRKRLLLVLDDVDHERHVEVFSDIAHMVAAESIILMTSREKDILKFELDDNELYEVPFLSENDARPLFMSHAFPTQPRPPPALEKHVHDIVMKCEGLPLTLEVLGRCLRGQQDVKVWEQALDALGEADSALRLNERLWKKLRVSYNRLEEEVQHMFLDATTFFSNRRYDRHTFSSDRWTLTDAKAAWSAIYGHESLRWKALVDASLVYDVEEHEAIKIHEQLLSLGRKIASDDAKKGVQGRRVWEREEGCKLLQSANEADHQAIHSLRLSELQPGPFNLPRTSLSILKEVKYLDVDIKTFKRISIDGAHENETLGINLIILRSPDLHFGHIPFDLALSHLVVLDLTGYDQQSLPNSFGQLSKLKVFYINGARVLETLPQSFGGLSSLNRLSLFACPKLHSLPESFGGLSSLNHLSIDGCNNLHSLPEAFGGLSSLNHLSIDGCNNLHSLPEAFGGLSSLNHLSIDGCNNLHSLPESFGGLSSLNHLTIFCCEKLHSLPESFGGLSSLNHLTIFGCEKLHSLPESFGELSSLNHLTISSCSKLHSLPESFGGLSSLTHLAFLGCKNLHTLPVFFGQLQHLNYLELSKCPRLERLPDSVSQLKALRHLTIKLLPLRSIPECINSLPSLQILELGVLPCLKTWPPWLGQMLSAPPKLCHLQKFSRAQERYFVLEDLKEEEGELRSDQEWWYRNVRRNVMEEWWYINVQNNVMDKVRALDYTGALEAWSTVHIEFVDTKSWRPFLLQERGILKRLTGNLVGALEDLTAALEIYFKRGEDDYECRKHRGYVKYLLGDISGARTDAERALAIWSERHLEESRSYKNRDLQIEAKNLEEQLPGLRGCLGVDPINFLDFKLK